MSALWAGAIVCMAISVVLQLWTLRLNKKTDALNRHTAELWEQVDYRRSGATVLTADSYTDLAAAERALIANNPGSSIELLGGGAIWSAYRVTPQRAVRS